MRYKYFYSTIVLLLLSTLPLLITAQTLVDIKMDNFKRSPNFIHWTVKDNSDQPISKGYYKTDTLKTQNYFLFHIDAEGKLTDTLKMYDSNYLETLIIFDKGSICEHKLFRKDGTVKQLIIPKGENYSRYLYASNGEVYEERLENSKVLYKRTKLKNGEEKEIDYERNVERKFEDGLLVSEFFFSVKDENIAKKELIYDNGIVVLEMVYYKNGSLEIKKYDKSGRLIQESSDRIMEVK